MQQASVKDETRRVGGEKQAAGKQMSTDSPAVIEQHTVHTDCTYTAWSQLPEGREGAGNLM